MDGEFVSLVGEAKGLNSKVFSLVRLELLSGLSALGREGATFRELKAILGGSDGGLLANLKALEAMGYVKRATVTLESRKLESFQVTEQGVEQWEHVRAWLHKFVARGGD